MEIEINEAEWQHLATMGKGAERGLQAAGISNYAEALLACDGLQKHRAVSDAKYALDDLICLLCLSQHKEAEVSMCAPEPAPPVSVRDDLELHLHAEPPKTLQPLAQTKGSVRLKKKTPAKHKIVSVMSWVLHELLCWCSISAAKSLCQCCRGLHAGGLFLAIRKLHSKRNVAESMESLLFSKAIAMRQRGISRSQVLRMLACGWDLLEKCAAVWSDEHLMAWVLLRLSAKFELAAEVCDRALEILHREGEKKVISSLESRLTMMLWSSGEPHIPALPDATTNAASGAIALQSTRKRMQPLVRVCTQTNADPGATQHIT